MVNQTKAELEAEIKNLKEQLENKKKEEQFDDCAKNCHSMYASYVKAGFTEEQAWELTKNLITNATSKRSIF